MKALPMYNIKFFRATVRVTSEQKFKIICHISVKHNQLYSGMPTCFVIRPTSQKLLK